MKFNDYQIEAVRCEESATCIATAGSGKTSVLVEKVYELSRTISPEKILCVAFNNDAVDNMKRKLYERDASLRSVVVSTIHSAALGCIRRSGCKPVIITDRYNKVDYSTGKIIKHGVVDFMSSVVDKYMMEVNSHNDDLPETMLRYVGLKLSTMEEEISGFEDYFEPNYLNRIYQDFINLLDSNNFLTYDMMCWKAINVLNENLELRDYVQNKYRYILVDESQDLSKDQYELIKIIAAKCKVFMVGDGLQSIYNFRGGTSHFLMRAYKDFEGMQVIHLPINYRCSEAIIETANKIASITPEADDENYVPAIANNKGGVKPLVIRSYDMGARIAEILNKTKSGDWKDTAILARTNAVLLNLKSSLFKHRIPCYFNEKVGIPKEVKLVCDYLSLIVDGNDDKAFLKVINTPRRYIGKETLGKIEAMARKRKLSLFDAALYAVYPKDRCYDNLITFIEKIEAFRVHKYRNAAFGLKDVVRKFKLSEAIREQYKGDDGAYQDAMDNIDELIKEAECYKTICEYAQNLIDVISANDEDGVALTTVHKAKGLEWDTVIIAGFNNGLFPHKRNDNIDEEIHILYVAATRAKNNLIFLQDQKNADSPFLEVIKDTVVIEKDKKKKTKNFSKNP